MDRLELLIQGAIAMLIVAGLVTVSVVEVVLGRPFAVPDILSFAGASVLGYFFGARAVKVGISAGSNGVLEAAAKIKAP